MFQIGECLKIKDDHRFGYIYDCFIDSFNRNYYQLVWVESDLYRPWNSDWNRIIFWEYEFDVPKTKLLKNGNRIVISR